MPEQDGTWQSVTHAELREGDRVRSTNRPDGHVTEGVVRALTCSFNPHTNQAVQVEVSEGLPPICQHFEYRTFERWVPTPTPETADEGGTWVPVASSRDLRPGDRARGVSRAGQVREGVVEEVTTLGHVLFEEQESPAGNTRRWSKFVPVAETWVPADPRTLAVGQRVRVRRQDSQWVEGEITRAPDEVYAYVNHGGYYLHRAYQVPGTAPAAPEPETPAFAPPQAPAPAGGAWVRVGSSSEVDDGDRIRWKRYEDDDEWVEGIVSEVDADRDVYLEGRDSYLYSGGVFERWTPDAAPQVEGLPGWATSLEAARRHVHAAARRLYLSGQNCDSGTRDFMEAAGLPSHRREYPAPPDESAQVAEFLAAVRQAALNTADRHGKSRRTIEAWLETEGIDEPKPTTRRVTIDVTVPIDADVNQVVRGLGWEVH